MKFNNSVAPAPALGTPCDYSDLAAAAAQANLERERASKSTRKAVVTCLAVACCPCLVCCGLCVAVSRCAIWALSCCGCGCRYGPFDGDYDEAADPADGMTKYD